MNKIEKIFLGVVVLLFLSQFIQPKKNQGEYNLKPFLTETNPSNNVKTILFNACYDCHSNNTQYPWYFTVTPINFRIKAHIDEGKKHLNFSDWSSYNKNQKAHVLEEVIEVIEKREMPLKTYVWLHNEGNLTKENAKLVIDWATKTKKQYK